MQEVVLVIHLMLAVALVVTVLLQQSEGGALGIGGGQGSMMTGRSAANLLTKLTTIFVACFFVTSLVLAWLAKQDSATSSVLDEAAPAAVTQPAVPELPAPTEPQVPQSN
ncbi:preprotein translocase subunit SecG [Pseudemcibacter aquimaris]|uniref:preprotein translocase subunit SecG n=1 Tax=Pseudemcibacter aquimaris TaxID=2857064 RepID=UPI00201390B3|nr:preprotein translocase subunit SecG [Pseudemcibacter aquimaris]MCC3859944.1 preprotein translocase subunit SecG [Pseudemcibacter aquimaris]WDU57276.1 preprotein translocase subunit SecG [Pseudemcibacter aquimaris]